MMAVETPVRLTVEEYLAWEEKNFEKHEYIDGEVRSMAGANRRHNRIVWNLATLIALEIDESRCSAFIAEMKVKSAGLKETHYLYPDLCAVCGEERFESASEIVLLNPVLAIEVSSPSSLVHDHGEKRDLYFDVPSIQTYLIIDQHRVCAELNIRSESGWQATSFEKLDDVAPIEVLDCNLPLAQVYRGIRFEPQVD
ncbi:MAG: Uma2 family endonuclease [Chloroflexota bacterium]|nr:Uma2 family endonuclease [Chloroflexota bacterium]